MSCRAVRGAISVKKNSEKEILSAATELLQAIVTANRIKVKDIVSIIFTVTSDLNAQFPAQAARKLGWDNIPMLCAYEIKVKQSLRQCLRIMLTFNSWKPQSWIKHQYLRQAVQLRPDLAE
jgi:chorismate mutase